MKYLSFLIALFACQVSWTQNIYGSISGGYQRIFQGSQPPSYIVNTYHQISNPWFWQPEDRSFSEAMSTDLSFGHMITENIGYELTGSFLKPLTVAEDDGYVERAFSGRFFKGSAKLVLSVPIKKFDVYSKLGVNYTMGILFYYQRMYNAGSIPLSFDESTLKYEYSNGSKFGFNFAAGTCYHLNSRLSFFAEVYAIHQAFEPTKGERIEQTTDGIDQMQYGAEPYFSEVEFGDESESFYYTSDDPSQPQKLYRRNYSLSGIGVSLGVKFRLWVK